MVMPFGLTNAPATFQFLMNDIFQRHLRHFILVFFDDILGYSPEKETLEILGRDTRDTTRASVSYQFKKMHLYEEQAGIFRTPNLHRRVQPDPEKVGAMVDWPVPKNFKDLWGFLGLTGYYRRFVRNYGKIVAPLTSILKKDAFKWSEEAQIAFENLKQAMVLVPVLAMPYFSLPFEL